MLRTILLISTFCVAAYASGQLNILHSPKSLDFKATNEKLEAESLGDVFAASLGQSVEHSSDWNGLYINDPFNSAKGVVVLMVDGIEKLHVSHKYRSYNIISSGAQESLDSLEQRVHSRILDLADNPEDVSAKLETDKTASALKPQLYEADKLFLNQFAQLEAFASQLQVTEPSDQPPLWIVRLSLGPLVAAHQLSSPAISEAMKLISTATNILSIAAQKGYGGDVVVAVVSVKDDVIVRSKRATKQTDPIPEQRHELNLAPRYPESYPVMFNIILWFGVVMAFSLLAISYTIGYMDPGRDSIIYRMTSTRMKKDN